MALRTKIPCVCTSEHYRLLHGKYGESFSCSYCHGTKEYEIDVTFNKFKDGFKPVDWEKIDNCNYDLSFFFTCECGDEILLVEGTKACSCGRVYRLQYGIDVNVDYLGMPESLISLYHAERKLVEAEDG